LLTLVFGGQLLAGYAGQPRRLFDPYRYALLERLLPLNQWTSALAFALFASQLVFVWNLWRTLRRPREEVENPWQVGTLEWTHRPTENETAPVVLRGPHVFAAVVLGTELGRDFLGQAEPLPAGVEEP
jgi:cytochrome c oxidase subunit 1